MISDSMKSFISLILVIFTIVTAEEFDIEILPDSSCDCRDWYGGCRTNGQTWIDDNVWIYSCENGNTQKPKDADITGCQDSNGNEVKVGSNTTIGELWHSCERNENRLKFEIEPHCNVNGEKRKVGEEYRDGSFQWLCLSTGRWITGCYYFNETKTDLLLKVGEHAYNGLIEHVCEKRQEYPAIVQYFTQVRKDVDVKHPTNKGINKNFPEPLQKLIADDENVRWLHNSAEHFIKNEDKPLTFVRYLPASRRPLDG